MIGTRPEAIKLAPVFHALSKRPAFDVECLVTSQHTDLLQPMLEFFDIEPIADLQVMTAAQKLEDVCARIITGTAEVLRARKTELVIVQGDTTTAFAAALAAFYLKIPVAHVEAGLRSNDLSSPFPEEAHRRWVDLFARYLFPPTLETQANLLAEGVPANRIFVTGNTGIDALLQTKKRLEIMGEPLPIEVPKGHQLMLVTAHRRESFGPPMERVFRAIRTLADARPNLTVLLPLHPNPQVRAMAGILADHPRIHLTEPLNYPQFVMSMARANLILTDSGGVQEEAPALGTPVLVTRDNTERPEAVLCGATELVGTDETRIVSRAAALLDLGENNRIVRNVYGDGTASEQIAEVLSQAE